MKESVLVKALLQLIAEHLTSEFHAGRWASITIIFDQHLSPEGQQFVLNNIYIPKGKQNKCDISKMSDVQESLRIRTTF